MNVERTDEAAFLRAAAREIVHRTCAAQNLPVKVTDQATVERVATLLDTADSRARRRAAGLGAAP